MRKAPVVIFLTVKLIAHSLISLRMDFLPCPKD